MFRRDSLAEDKGLRGVQAEANWRSRPRQPSSSGLRPGQAARPGARRILGKAAGASRGGSSGNAELPARWAARFPAATEAGRGRWGCGVLSAGGTKAARLRRGAGRTGARAAPPGDKVGLSSAPPSSSGQSRPANVLTRGIAGRAEDAEHFLGATGLSADASLSLIAPGGKNHS